MAYQPIPTPVSILGSVSGVGTFRVDPVSSVAVNIIAGSIAATFTPPANQSVSGTVNVGNLPAVQPVSGSVAVLQGTNPLIITGSVQGSFSPSGNQSVSGTVNVGNLPTTQNVSGSVAAWLSSSDASVITAVRGSVAVNIIAGSIAATFTPPANQSVSGTVNVTQGTTPWVQTGSVQGTVSVLGTVPVTQSTSPWVITGSVQGSFSPSGNQSVSGTVQVDVRASVGAVIIGGSIATATTNSSVMLLSSPNAIGSVAALQGTNPWVITGSVQGSFSPAANQSVSGAVDVANFPATQNVSGSVAAFQAGTQVTSLVSTVPSSVIVGASIFGLAPVNVTNANLNVAGSVVSFQGTSPWIITGSVQGSFSPAANQSVSGTVQVDVRASVAAVIIGGSVATATTNSSVMLLNSANAIGSVAALQGTAEWTVKSSLAGGIFPISGSVAVGNFPATQNVSGSVVAFQGGTQITSLVSTVPSSVIVGASIFGLPPVNVTNTNLNVSGSVAAFLTGSASVAAVPKSPGTPFYYQGSVVSTSVTLVAASISGQRHYVTDVILANTGTAGTRVTLRDGSTSLMAHLIAPAGGGSNLPGIKTPPRTAASQDLAFQAVTATSVLYLTVTGYSE